MFLGRGTHITRDMCFLGGEHISLGICTEADKGQSQNINEIRKTVFKIRKKYFKS